MLAAGKPSSRYAVAGAGGHGRVVADALMASGEASLVGFLDDDAGLLGRGGALPVLGELTSWRQHQIDCIVLGIGANRARAQAYERLLATNATVARLLHRTALVSASAAIGDATVILAAAIVNTEARIGANTLVNTAAIVEHGCTIGAHVHLAPRSCLGGEVVVGDGSLIGLGSLVLPGLRVGNWCVIGAGAVVTRDVADGTVVAGVPARRMP